MLQICINKCQVRVGKKIHTVRVGKTMEIEGKHACFRPIGEHKIDFSKAGREELQAGKWNFSEANDAMASLYSKELFKEEGTKKSDIIDQILDIRYRAIDVNPNTTVTLPVE